ncbi:hypothetical protein M404DRAFT_297786 [Pisolithus tinctorius Marx 270]|uniref:Uncharacterized protein n=1 Tax=Pisolithus tinctorius Marx 270 TaxID=870435 RepID=A0A0C3N3U3_PISTI|nr:hypothetical protein M404DRAFT_297786 [Pisolithus tinctorius Marx 270]
MCSVRFSTEESFMFRGSGSPLRNVVHMCHSTDETGYHCDRSSGWLSVMKRQMAHQTKTAHRVIKQFLCKTRVICIRTRARTCWDPLPDDTFRLRDKGRMVGRSSEEYQYIVQA